MTIDESVNGNDKIIVHVDPDLEDLIPEFLEMRREDVKSITDSLANGDFENIRIRGHGMKGSGGGYGFDDITDMGAAIETAAKEENTEEVKKRVEELRGYLERVEVVYE